MNTKLFCYNYNFVSFQTVSWEVLDNIRELLVEHQRLLVEIRAVLARMEEKINENKKYINLFSSVIRSFPLREGGTAAHPVKTKSYLNFSGTLYDDMTSTEGGGRVLGRSGVTHATTFTGAYPMASLDNENLYTVFSSFQNQANVVSITLHVKR